MEPQNGCCWPTRLRPRWVVAADGVAMMTDPINGNAQRTGTHGPRSES